MRPVHRVQRLSIGGMIIADITVNSLTSTLPVRKVSCKLPELQRSSMIKDLLSSSLPQHNCLPSFHSRRHRETLQEKSRKQIEILFHKHLAMANRLNRLCTCLDSFDLFSGVQLGTPIMLQYVAWSSLLVAPF